MTQRSTKGASKQRRDAINERVGQLRDLLPLSNVTRSRLSQLQVMALVRSYIAKSNFFSDLSNKRSEVEDRSSMFCECFDFLQAVPGFLMIIGVDGRLLYISDNISDYLGNSSVDTMTQMETVYDLIDSRDQNALRVALQTAAAAGSSEQTTKDEDDDWANVSLSCRMNTTVRTSARCFAAPTGAGYDRCRVMHVSGRFVRTASNALLLGYSNRQQHQRRPSTDDGIALVAFCTPRLSIADQLLHVVQTSTASSDATNFAAAASGGRYVLPSLSTSVGVDTTFFRSVHSLDMKFVGVDANGEFYLDCNQNDVVGKSWYEMIHPEHIREAQFKHLELIRAAEIGDTTAYGELCVQVQARAGQFIWLHVIMRICGPDDYISSDIGYPASYLAHQRQQQQPMIVCVNHVINSEQAASVRSGVICGMKEIGTTEASVITNGTRNGSMTAGSTNSSPFSASGSTDGRLFLGTTIDQELMFDTFSFGSMMTTPEQGFGESSSHQLVVATSANGQQNVVVGHSVQSGRQLKRSSAASNSSSHQRGSSDSCSLAKVPRRLTEQDKTMMTAAANPSFMTGYGSIPSPPLYQWGIGCQQNPLDGTDDLTRCFGESPFPSSSYFMGATALGRTAAQQCYSMPAENPSAAFRSVALKEEYYAPSPVIPESFLTPNHSPISLTDCAQSPRSITSTSSSGRNYTLPNASSCSNDIFMTSDWFLPQNNSPPAHTVPEMISDCPSSASEVNLPASAAVQVGFLSSGEMSFFDNSVADQTKIGSGPNNELPELDPFSVTSVLDCLERQECLRQQQQQQQLSTSVHGSSSVWLVPSREEHSLGGMVVDVLATEGAIDEALIQSLLSVGSEFMQTVAGTAGQALAELMPSGIEAGGVRSGGCDASRSTFAAFCY